MNNQYDTTKSWKWNLDHSPELPGTACHLPAVEGDWRWCGIAVDSPLGVPAGPLLNGAWLLYYAHLGFDILVYKTVRSVTRDCYPLPNLVPVEAADLSIPHSTVPQSEQMNGSWAVSFGMPSQSADVWRRDVEETRRQLPPGKVLVVSVVGTQNESIADPAASLDHLADDFAQCAAWAVESGAHGVEANFSCPNVSTSDGQLFQQPEAAGQVAERIRNAIGAAPLVLKVGRVHDTEDAEDLLRAIAPFANGLAMTNSIAARVMDCQGQLLFDGQPRGICGDATRIASVEQTRLFRTAATQAGVSLDLIGVGGISTATHVQDYLNAGATSVALATAAMINPQIGLQIRKELPSAGLHPSMG